MFESFQCRARCGESGYLRVHVHVGGMDRAVRSFFCLLQLALRSLACCTRRPAVACDRGHLHTLLYTQFVQLMKRNFTARSARSYSGHLLASLRTGVFTADFRWLGLFLLHVLALGSLDKLSFVCRCREICDRELSVGPCTLTGKATASCT